MSMTPAERRARMLEQHGDIIREIVADAPPIPGDALALLRALNCPLPRKAKRDVG